MPDSLKLIAGLGNPGPEYSVTRHNAGFWFLDKLAGIHAASFSADNKIFGEVTRIRFDKIDCRLFKPHTFMNESGKAVQAIMNYYKISTEEILIVHDEIDLEPGVIRFKQGGGHAGHNGVRDIVNKIGSRDFKRLRIGVGHPGHKDKVIGSVLGKPSLDDKQQIDEAIDSALELMPMIFNGEYSKVMNELHRSEKDESDKTESKK